MHLLTIGKEHVPMTHKDDIVQQDVPIAGKYKT